MKDDPSLRDEQLESEIRLVGDLVLAASQCEGHMSEEEIDALLGLGPRAPGDDLDDDSVAGPDQAAKRGSKAS